MSTDPSSSDFDPLAALYGGSDESPDEGVTIYDNIAMFEGSLRKQELGITEQPGPSKKASKSFSAKAKVREEAETRDVGKLRELMEMRKQIDLGENPEAHHEEGRKQHAKKQHRKARKTLLTSMERLSKGPYSILHEIVKKHHRCNVYVRDFCGLRGVCTGYIVAYDRYMNLALIDIDETFRKPPLGKVIDHQKSLSISMLEEAIKSMNLGKDSVKVVRKGSKRDRATRRDDVSKPSTSTRRTGPDFRIKTVGTQFFKSGVFHGGTPQLYHRHMDQLLVKGDSIVLVSLKR